MSQHPPRVALFIDRLTDGGVQHSFLGLAGAFLNKGLKVDLVVGDRRNLHRHHALPEGLRVTFLTSGAPLASAWTDLAIRWSSRSFRDGHHVGALPRRWRVYLPGLTRFLAEARPDALLTAKTLGNLVGLLAVKRANVGTRIVVSDRVHLSTSIDRSRRDWKGKRLPKLVRALYPGADGVVAISRAVAEDLAVVGDMPPGRVITIHNGLLRAEALDQPAADHPWFYGDAPVVIGVGRLAKQKDFTTLIQAFAKLRARRPAKLMILGEGRERAELEALVQELGLGEDVQMPGFVDNPFAYLKAASLFVMSSTHEGFGNALLEALASGCPAISTDCPAGPREILDDGRVGPLVPVGDSAAMADAMERMLDNPPSRERLLERAADFSMARVADRYLACLLPERFGGRADTAA